MDYVFHTSAYNIETLVPEVSWALEKRVELASRQRLPGMWKVTDSVARKSGTPRSMTRGRLVYRRVVGIALIVLGLFMMIPGLMKPQELLLPLFVGVCGLVFGINALWSTRKKEGEEAIEETEAAEPVNEPEKKLSKKFESTARTFLTNLTNVGTTEVRFSKEGMHLTEQTVITYEELEYFIETQSGYLLAWGRQATFLQKKDLQHDDEDEFHSFVSCRVTSA